MDRQKYIMRKQRRQTWPSQIGPAARLENKYRGPEKSIQHNMLGINIFIFLLKFCVPTVYNIMVLNTLR